MGETERNGISNPHLRMRYVNEPVSDVSILFRIESDTFYVFSGPLQI